MSHLSLYLIHRLSIFLVAIYLFSCNRYKEVREELDFAFPNYIRCSVVKVLDGDTFDCQLPNIQIERVKLIGVMIPPSIEERAADFSKSYLRVGLPVKLEPDEVSYEGINILAYVYLPDGKMLNAFLIEQGFAEYDAKPPNVRYERYFLNLQNEAKELKRGLWKSSE